MLLYERDNDINDAGFPRSDGRLLVWACSASARSRLAQALFSVLWTFVGHFDSCSFALSCEALFTLLAEFVGPFDEVSRHFCATLTQKCTKTVPSPMKTIPITYRHRPDKQSPTSNARPCAPRSFAPVSPRHSRTNKVRPRMVGPARYGPPHQSLPDKNRTNKVRPRMLGAARLARTRVPNISPLTSNTILAVPLVLRSILCIIWPLAHCSHVLIMKYPHLYKNNCKNVQHQNIHMR